MKKTVLLIALLLLILLFTSCDLFTTDSTYSVGDTGPAGGIIFYDNDADNETGNADGLDSSIEGWRFLEAAPGDLFQRYEVPEILGDEGFRQWFKFGYHREGSHTSNLYVNETTGYSETNCTRIGIGEGLNNTNLLVADMGEMAYIDYIGQQKYIYAAGLASRLTYGTYSDWYLPSLNELKLIYSNRSILNTFDTMPGTNYYWSSSEGDMANSAYRFHFNDGSFEQAIRKEDGGIRVIRQF